MKRKLLTQIATEWKSNMWLAIELLLVSVVVWVVTDNLWVKTELRLQPIGVETDNCFKVGTALVNADSPAYDGQDSTDLTGMDHMLKLYDRLRHYPGVEHAAIVLNGTPYEMNFSGSNLITLDTPDTIMTTHNNIFTVSPEYVDVFKVKGSHGETSAQLKEMLAKGEIIMSLGLSVVSYADLRTIDQRNYEDWQRITRPAKREELVGHRMSFAGYGENDNNYPVWHVGATIVPIRRMEYEEATGNTIRALDLTNPELVCQSCFLVRVSPEARATFRHDILKESNNLFRSGNRFVGEVTEISAIRELTQSEEVATIRNFIVVMVFLLLCIFLGLLGTFWFRTQQRVSEIAIRKVNGATGADIFRRLIGEGLLLLLIITPVAVLLDYGVAHYLSEMPMSDYNLPTGRFLGGVTITFCLMALMIVLGIWFPATRAMRIDPATALKDE